MLVPTLQLLFGLGLLLVGANAVVSGASRLALRFGLTPLTVGLTVVAMGTSAPEAAVTVRAALAGQADLAAGNVLGSNVFNLLVVLGATAVVAPIVVSLQTVRREAPLALGATLLVLALAWDGSLGRLEGALLASLLVAQVLWLLRAARGSAALEPAATLPSGRTPAPLAVVAGLVLLALGAQVLVDGASTLARLWGLGEATIAVTIVAGGTSLPELAATLAAAARGERDMAVGNAIGSNLFNLLGCLGAAALVAPAGLPVGQEIVRFHGAVLVAASVLTLPLLATGLTLRRWEGGAMLAGYVAYVAATLSSVT